MYLVFANNTPGLETIKMFQHKREEAFAMISVIDFMNIIQSPEYLTQWFLM